MTNRQLFLDYVRKGGTPICSPQIGANAGFDAFMAGKPFAEMADTVKVCEMFDMVPLFNFNLDVGAADPSLCFEFKESVKNGSVTVNRHAMQTPYGDFGFEVSVSDFGGSFRSKDPVTGYEDLDKLNWFLDRLLNGDYSVFEKQVSDANAFIGNKGALDFQWGMQPYELFGFPNTLNTMLLAMDYETEFFALMDKCSEISKKIINCAASGGSDFVFLGGPAAEMVNPYIYDNFMVPYGKALTDYAHAKGLLIYSHVCSPVEPFLTLGYFNKLGIDLFETLSMPPVGNVKSLEDAFSKIDADICTRGNIGIDRLIQALPEQIYNETLAIMETAVRLKRKHIVAASDYLMAECKRENVAAMCRAVRDFTQK